MDSPSGKGGPHFAPLESRRALVDHRPVGAHDLVHGRNDVVVFRPEAMLHLVEVDHDANVGGDRTLGGREHRVEVHLRDFGEVADQFGG